MIFVVLPEVEILDLAGPLQAFSEACWRYRVRICSNRERVRSHQGIVLADLDRLPDIEELVRSSRFAVRSGETVPPQATGVPLRTADPELQTASPIVVVPGMPYAATQKVERTITRWLVAAARAGAHIASVCTGAFIVGEAGLLDGRRCTTHWSRTSELARRFPSARVLEDRLYVTDGNVTTSAGIASGIDMALAFIEQADGPLVAAEVAREMVVYLRRDGAQQQRSVYLDYRTHIHPGVHRAQDFRRHERPQPYPHLPRGDRHLRPPVHDPRPRRARPHADARSRLDDGCRCTKVRPERAPIAAAGRDVVREIGRRDQARRFARTVLADTFAGAAVRVALIAHRSTVLAVS